MDSSEEFGDTARHDHQHEWQPCPGIKTIRLFGRSAWDAWGYECRACEPHAYLAIHATPEGVIAVESPAPDYKMFQQLILIEKHAAALKGRLSE